MGLTFVTNLWNEILENLTVADLGKKFCGILEPARSWRCLQDPSIGSSSEPDLYGLQLHIPF